MVAYLSKYRIAFLLLLVLGCDTSFGQEVKEDCENRPFGATADFGTHEGFIVETAEGIRFVPKSDVGARAIMTFLPQISPRRPKDHPPSNLRSLLGKVVAVDGELTPDLFGLLTIYLVRSECIRVIE